MASSDRGLNAMLTTRTGRPICCAASCAGNAAGKKHASNRNAIAVSAVKKWFLFMLVPSAEEMSHSVFIASASNPDGVKKASRQMEAKRRNSRELRDELALFGSNENRNIILNLFDHSRAGWAPKIVTNDDLIKELNKQMQGVKDKHDLFFEETYAERRRLAEEEEELRASEARRKYSEVSPDSVFQGSAHVTEEEMSSAIAGVRDIRTVVAGRAAANGLSGVPHVGHRVLRR